MRVDVFFSKATVGSLALYDSDDAIVKRNEPSPFSRRGPGANYIVIGSEQSGVRPSLIVQNDAGNRCSPTTQIVPLTTRRKSAILPTHVYISSACGLGVTSIALVEQLRTVDKSRLGICIGRINAIEQTAINEALAISVGLGASA